MSRQPVLDETMGVARYPIAYAYEDGNEVLGPHPALLFDSALSVIGLRELVGDSIAHLPITRELILALGAPPGRPERMMLRIAHCDAVDPVLSPMLEAAADRGYALELDALPGPAVDPDLLDLFNVASRRSSGCSRRARRSSKSSR